MAIRRTFAVHANVRWVKIISPSESVLLPSSKKSDADWLESANIYRLWEAAMPNVAARSKAMNAHHSRLK